MDAASRLLIQSAVKLLIAATNGGTLTKEEDLRVHAAYRRLIIALNVERKKQNSK